MVGGWRERVLTIDTNQGNVADERVLVLGGDDCIINSVSTEAHRSFLLYLGKRSYSLSSFWVTGL